jgi:hypothetical protein
MGANKINAEMLQMLENIKAALDSGYLIGDPAILRSGGEGMAKFVKLINDLCSTIYRAKGGFTFAKWYIDHADLGEDSRFEPRFSSIEISSEGSTFLELLENATYNWIDQDGGDLGDGPANDTRAVRFITEWCEKRGISLEIEKNSDRQYEIQRDLELDNDNE